MAPFSALAHRYVEEHAKIKNKSWRHADKLVQRYLLPSWAEVDVSAITRTDVRRVIGKISAPQLANQVRIAASAIFTWAVANDIVTSNPCRGIAGHATTSRERILSDTEVKLFMQAFRQAGNPGRALQFLLLTGQRPGEVARLQHRHIKDGSWWCMPGKADGNGWLGTKNGLSHRVWLPEAVRELTGTNVSVGSSKTGGPNGPVGSAHEQSVARPTISGFVFPRHNAMRLTMKRICQQLNVELHPTRSTAHPWQHHHAVRLWPQCHEPNSKSSRGRHCRCLRPAQVMKRKSGNCRGGSGASAGAEQIITIATNYLLALAPAGEIQISDFGANFSGARGGKIVLPYG